MGLSQMLPRPPKKESDQQHIDAYRAELQDLSKTLRNRFDREFFRKELQRRSKYYQTLSGKQVHESNAARFFSELARLHQEELESFGPEPPPKRRRRYESSVTPVYPDLPERFFCRVHFISCGSLRRDRSTALAQYADALSHQAAPNGDVLTSVAVAPDRVQFYERLIESIGESGLGILAGKNGGFSSDSESTPAWEALRHDNHWARSYLYANQRAASCLGLELPEDAPPVPESLPWDPDPRFQEILSLTHQDRLVEAQACVDRIPAVEREVLFDEILYLRYLTGCLPQGDDLRWFAHFYIKRSSISDWLQEDFEEFVRYVDDALAETEAPHEFFADLDRFPLGGASSADAGDLEQLPLLKDWQATREHFYQKYQVYGHPPCPRGRIFVWNPEIGTRRCWSVETFQSIFLAAEDAFRRERSIAEIGKGWVSETKLYNLIRELYHDAKHQWRPMFLGGQSVDIYIPSLNLAIEYQGEQHYEPVTRFGGAASLKTTRERDERKRTRLAARGVRLLEWPYDRVITRSEVRAAISKFEECPPTSRS